jgi:hypothetical protein
MPAQNGVVRCCHFLNGCNSQHRSGGVEHQRKLVLAYQVQTKSLTIERLGTTRVARRDESREPVRSQHRFRLPRASRFMSSVTR